jgi:DNA adenine methylase
MPKTPLRYPGGKSRAVKKILPYIQDFGGAELCSPFLGGGSVELACAEEGMTVHGYDAFNPVVWFWQALLSDNIKLADTVESYRRPVRDYTTEKEFGDWWQKKCTPGKCRVTDKKTAAYCNNHKQLKALWRGYTEGTCRDTFSLMRRLVNRSEPKNAKELFDYAAYYYIVNRSSFSGATTSGGWSWKASWARLTDSTLQNLRDFSMENFSAKRADFKESILAHPDATIYADPPYALNKQEDSGHSNKETLYGRDGDHHGAFDHEGLAALLKQRDNWVLSYNDCSYIRDLYDGYAIAGEEWSYGMRNVNSEKMGESSEIIIVG